MTQQRENENQEPVVANDTEAPYSDYQSVWSFSLLCLLSFGIYPFFWFYKHWVYLRDEKQEDISPGMRTLFTVVYGFVLFKKFAALAVEKGHKGQVPPALLFLLYLATVLAVYLDNVLGLLIGICSFVFLVPMLQAMNVYYLSVQPGYRVRKGLAKDEIVFLCLVWAVVLYMRFFAG